MSAVQERLKIASLEEGMAVTGAANCYLLVRRVTLKSGKNSTRYLDLDLFDGTTGINGKVWEVTPEIEKILEAGVIVQVVKGRVARYQNALQLVIEAAAAVSPGMLDRLGDLVPQSPQSAEELMRRWRTLADTLDAPRRAVIVEFEKTGQVWDLFRAIPAGKSMHHNYRRGLWEHSLNVAELSYDLARRYESRYPVNRMQVLLGAMLHDVGKVFEFQVNASTSVVERYTDSGKLLGHVYMGAAFVEKLLKKAVPDDATLRMEILHIMLSHHGEYEFGSPKQPQTMDALIVSMVDNLDANLDAVHIGLTGEMDENWTKTIFSLQRAFYRTAGPHEE